MYDQRNKQHLNLQHSKKKNWDCICFKMTLMQTATQCSHKQIWDSKWNSGSYSKPQQINTFRKQYDAACKKNDILTHDTIGEKWVFTDLVPTTVKFLIRVRISFHRKCPQSYKQYSCVDEVAKQSKSAQLPKIEPQQFLIVNR